MVDLRSGRPRRAHRRYEVTASLEARLPKAAALLRDARTDVLAFTAFPRAHWRKIWSNNPLERLHKEVERRSNVVGIAPNDTAAIRLIGAVHADQHEWAIARRYLSEVSMVELTTPRHTTPPRPPSRAELSPPRSPEKPHRSTGLRRSRIRSRCSGGPLKPAGAAAATVLGRV